MCHYQVCAMFFCATGYTFELSLNFSSTAAWFCMILCLPDSYALPLLTDVACITLKTFVLSQFCFDFYFFPIHFSPCLLDGSRHAMGNTIALHQPLQTHLSALGSSMPLSSNARFCYSCFIDISPCLLNIFRRAMYNTIALHQSFQTHLSALRSSMPSSSNARFCIFSCPLPFPTSHLYISTSMHPTWLKLGPLDSRILWLSTAYHCISIACVAIECVHFSPHTRHPVFPPFSSTSMETLCCQHL
jgi:hypothetical protein